MYQVATLVGYIVATLGHTYAGHVGASLGQYAMAKALFGDALKYAYVEMMTTPDEAGALRDSFGQPERDFTSVLEQYPQVKHSPLLGNGHIFVGNPLMASRWVTPTRFGCSWQVDIEKPADIPRVGRKSLAVLLAGPLTGAAVHIVGYVIASQLEERLQDGQRFDKNWTFKKLTWLYKWGSVLSALEHISHLVPGIRHRAVGDQMRDIWRLMHTDPEQWGPDESVDILV